MAYIMWYLVAFPLQLFGCFCFSVLNKDPFNSQCLPLHVAVLVELKKANGESI